MVPDWLSKTTSEPPSFADESLTKAVKVSPEDINQYILLFCSSTT